MRDVYLALVGVLLLILVTSMNKANAESSYCNDYGSGRMSCNTYHDNGHTDSTYFNQYGSGGTIYQNNYNDRGNNDN